MDQTRDMYPGADRRADRRESAERRAPSERRGDFCGGRRLSDAVRAGALTLSLFAAAGGAAGAAEAPVRRPVATSTKSGPMRFGVDVDSVKDLKAKGVDVSYGNFWVGPWTQKQGWANTDRELKIAKSQGVTPVINWWYWGDDISPQFVEQGGRDKYQGVHKDRATWIRMSTELADHIHQTMGDRETIVVLETEFNKQGIETYEAFDGYLAEVVKIFHRKGNIKVVIGFGNWAPQHWSRFDRAVGEADIVGTQLLQSSVRDKGTYLNSVDTVIAGTKTLQNLFHKPVLLIDFIVSSYPAATYEANQEKVVQELFKRLPELKAAGLEGLIWRSLKDDPKFDTANYHGVAERHWGLVRADGSFKKAYGTFVSGVAQERSSGAGNAN